MAESRTSSSLGLILLLAVAVWTFRSSLGNPFHFDDNLFLQSPQVTEPGDPWYLLKPTQTRQLTYLTFYWNYRAGAMSPVGYHLVNLLLHLANALSLYWFARLLMRRRTGSFDPLVQRWLPLAAAGIFALHPVQTEAVNYIYQRSTLLAAFFSLISMASFLQAQLSQNRRTWFALSGFCFFLAAALLYRVRDERKSRPARRTNGEAPKQPSEALVGCQEYGFYTWQMRYRRCRP